MNRLNEKNLLKALFTNPRAGYELARNLGVGMEANRVYERVSTKPGQEQVKASKWGIVVKKANIVVGILSTLQEKVGYPIIMQRVETDAEKIEFMYDVDDFFNELYSSQQEKAN